MHQHIVRRDARCSVLGGAAWRINPYCKGLESPVNRVDGIVHGHVGVGEIHKRDGRTFLPVTTTADSMLVCQSMTAFPAVDAEPNASPSVNPMTG